jgi:hypothetical protein
MSAPLTGLCGDDAARMRWGNELDVAIIPDENVGRRLRPAWPSIWKRSTEDESVIDHAVNSILAAWGYCWCWDYLRTRGWKHDNAFFTSIYER